MRLTGALLLVLVAATPLRSQSRDARESYQVGFDNDAIGLRERGAPPDYDYSSGLSLSVLQAQAPAWLQSLVRRRARCDDANSRTTGCVGFQYGVTHQIYTPRLNANSVIPGQRPYAGWFYTSADVHMVRGAHSRSFGVDLGVLGPLAFAEQVQNRLHRLFAHAVRLGWKDQIGNAPGLTVRYDEAARFEGSAGRVVPALDVGWSAAAGNVLNVASGEVSVSLGVGGRLPWNPSEPRVTKPTRGYATAGYRQDVVLQSVFIDGRANGPAARRRGVVGQWNAGLGVRHKYGSIEYLHIVRGQEYDAQESPHPYGTIRISANRF